MQSFGKAVHSLWTIGTLIACKLHDVIAYFDDSNPEKSLVVHELTQIVICIFSSSKNSRVEYVIYRSLPCEIFLQRFWI